METDLAPVTFHCNNEECPAVMLPGFEVKLTITGGPSGEVTVTVVEAITEPELLMAVKVYVVVMEGDTDFVPDSGTVPIP